MAEAVAITGLVASITSLVEISAKIVSRLRDFTSDASDIPESFRSLSIQLPLLTATLQRIQSQAEASHFPNDVVIALKTVVDYTVEQVVNVQTSLSHVLPSEGDSKLERAVKALKSLAKDDKVQQALKKIHESNDILVLHQTTSHNDLAYLILEQVSRLRLAAPSGSRSLGVCLGRAPQIAPTTFVGRTKELKQLREWLCPKSCLNDLQRVVSIVGMGGLGKTQLSIAHTRDCANDYSSIFWLNAKDEPTLRRGIADLDTLISHESAGPVAKITDGEELKINKVRRWLSEPGNNQWLLIFDNYDNPYLSETDNLTGYDIRKYFPHRTTGSILITTRSPRLSFSEKPRLEKLQDIKQSLAILAIISGRNNERGKAIVLNDK